MTKPNDAQATQAASPKQAEPVGEVEQIDTSEDGDVSAWVALYSPVEIGAKLYATPQQAVSAQELSEALREAAIALKEAEFLLHKVYTDHGITQIDGEDGAWIFVSKAADRMDAAIDKTNAALATLTSTPQQTIECFDCSRISCICDAICSRERL